jgi:hypothetical protein
MYVCVAGTTQVAGRVAAGDVLPLDEYLGKLTEQTGISLTDDFVR